MTQTASPDSTPSAPAAPWRRLAAGAYDLLPLAARWMAAGALALPVGRDGFIAPGTLWFQLLLFAVTLAYYAASWKLGGQTIGMRAWRVRVRSATPAPLDWPRALLRFAVSLLSLAALGAGVWWALFDARRRMWHDIAAGTVVVREPL